MADKKISALTSATTPLAGTEVLPIVQSASTVKVTVNDMLAVTNWTSPAVNSEGNMFLRATDALATGVGTQIGLGGKYNATSYFPFAAVSGRKENATNNNVAGYLSLLTTTSGGTLTERARISSTGDITANTGNLVIGTTAKGITTGSAIPLGFGVNNTVTAITIDTASNVGIGVSSPTNKLQINGDVAVSFGNSGGNKFWTVFSNDYRNGMLVDGNNRVTQIFATTAAGDAGGIITFSTRQGTASGATDYGTERMRIEPTGNVGIGTTSPAATAILDVQSTTKGVRFPNMTTTQKNAITPSAGTVIFDTTLAKLCVYSGSAWQTVTSI